MSQSTRFIMVALVGWVGVRALSLGMVPGGEAFAFDRPAIDKAAAAPALPPVATTEFPPLEPVAPPADPYATVYGAYPPAYPRPYAIPYGVPVA